MLAQDNQQETSWFVGILEGEGSFRNTAKSNVEVRISNTDLDIIETCEKFLKQSNIIFNTSEGKRLGSRREYSISIRKSREILFNYPEILYKLIENKLQCRKEEYQRILGSSETTCDLSVDFDWLIGVWEAEGSFSLVKNNRDRMALKIEISNTNYKILEKVAITLKTMGCSWYVESKQREAHWKEAQAICICGMKRCQRFLMKTRGYWRADKNTKRSELMLEFINKRLVKSQKEPYSDRELEIPNIMKQLNQKGG